MKKIRNWFSKKHKKAAEDHDAVLEKHRHVHWMRSPHAQLSLGLISFSESLFAPIITDPFLVAIILTDRLRWIRYTVITIISSVAGGFAAFILGAVFFEVFGVWLLQTFSLYDLFIESTQNISGAGFWFVFLGALTPIPYKLVALAAGFAGVPIWSFLLASLIGRTLRFAITGYLTYMFGSMALQLFQYRLNTVYILIVLVVSFYIFYKIMGG